MKDNPVRKCNVYARPISINKADHGGIGKALRSEATKQHTRNPEGLAFLA